MAAGDAFFILMVVSSCSAVATRFCETELTRVVINENLEKRGERRREKSKRGFCQDYVRMH